MSSFYHLTHKTWRYFKKMAFVSNTFISSQNVLKGQDSLFNIFYKFWNIIQECTSYKGKGMPWPYKMNMKLQNSSIRICGKACFLVSSTFSHWIRIFAYSWSPYARPSNSYTKAQNFFSFIMKYAISKSILLFGMRII